MNSELPLVHVKLALGMTPVGSDYDRARWADYEHPLNQVQLDKLAMELCYRLAPENLHQDGERTADEVEERYEEIMATGAHLQTYAKQNNLSPREISEDYV